MFCGERLFVYFLALAMLAGPALVFTRYDFRPIDSTTYIAIANGEFQGQSSTRKYRILVPYAAKAVSAAIAVLHPPSSPLEKEKELCIGFYIVNCLLMALAGLFIYLTCKAYGSPPFCSLIGMISVLTSWWGNYFAGVIFTDSLFMLVIVLSIYAIRTGDKTALLFSIFAGPLAKESYVFMAILVFLFAKSFSRSRLFLLFALSFLLAFGVRWMIDGQEYSSLQFNLKDAFRDIFAATASLRSSFTLVGIAEIVRTNGLFLLILLAGFFGGRDARHSWMKIIDRPLIFLLAITCLFALLLAAFSRMLFLASPLWAVAISAIIARHPYFKRVRMIFSVPEPE